MGGVQEARRRVLLKRGASSTQLPTPQSSRLRYVSPSSEGPPGHAHDESPNEVPPPNDVEPEHQNSSAQASAPSSNEKSMTSSEATRRALSTMSARGRTAAASCAGARRVCSHLRGSRPVRGPA